MHQARRRACRVQAHPLELTTLSEKRHAKLGMWSSALRELAHIILLLPRNSLVGCANTAPRLVKRNWTPTGPEWKGHALHVQDSIHSPRNLLKCCLCCMQQADHAGSSKLPRRSVLHVCSRSGVPTQETEEERTAGMPIQHRLPMSFCCRCSSFSCTQKRRAELSLAAAGSPQKAERNVSPREELSGKVRPASRLQLWL